MGKRLGRPPKPHGEKYGKMVSFKVTEAELKRLTTEARRRGISLSALMMEPWRRA